MISKLMNVIAYRKAPKATFVLKHPVKGVKALLAVKGGKALFTGRAGLVLGALAAVPVGLWATSRMGNG